MSYKTPKVDKDTLKELNELNNFYDESNFGRYLELQEEERDTLALDPDNLKL